MSHEPPPPPPTFFPRLTVYSAKFLCGEFRLDRAAEKRGHEGPVKPGNYATAINIHNPSPWRTVAFRKKAVLLFDGSDPHAADEPERPREPGRTFSVELRPDFGMEIDCPDIRTVLLEGKVKAPMFIKGWVVIETWDPSPLDVVAVYTAHTFLDNRPEGFSLETDRVPGVSVPFFWPWS